MAEAREGQKQQDGPERHLTMPGARTGAGPRSVFLPFRGPLARAGLRLQEQARAQGEDDGHEQERFRLERGQGLHESAGDDDAAAGDAEHDRAGAPRRADAQDEKPGGEAETAEQADRPVHKPRRRGGRPELEKERRAERGAAKVPYPAPQNGAAPQVPLQTEHHQKTHRHGQDHGQTAELVVENEGRRVSVAPQDQPQPRRQAGKAQYEAKSLEHRRNPRRTVSAAAPVIFFPTGENTRPPGWKGPYPPGSRRFCLSPF